MNTTDILVLIGSIIAFIGLIGYATYLVFFKKPAPAMTQIVGQIKNYIATYASQGYSIDALKQGLISQGYNSADIDTAIQLYQKGR